MRNPRGKKTTNLPPWVTPRPSTQELVFDTIQLILAKGPLEPWEIPVWASDAHIPALRDYLNAVKTGAENE